MVADQLAARPLSVANWIGGREVPAASGETFEKTSPHDGGPVAEVARSGAGDIDAAVRAARGAAAAWADTTPVARGEALLKVALALEASASRMAAIVALETGKSVKEATGETKGAVQLGKFFAGEGMRLSGRTFPSGMAGKYTMTVRSPLGVAALIIAANTPIANIAWKVFPALICGNACVVKAAEETPATALEFARIAAEAGLPAGVLNVVQGIGAEAGQALVDHGDVDVISFTGSTAVGRKIAASAGPRMVRISLELGGKNPLVVCDDADLDKAVEWTVLSAFSNAGQRCAAASHIIVAEQVYDAFRDKLLARTASLKVGNTDADDFGPVINVRQLGFILAQIDAAKARGARVAAGGIRLAGERHAKGSYLAPTVIEDVPAGDPLNGCELFGPVAVLSKASDFRDALRQANDRDYGLTAAIHTRSVDRATEFAHKVRAGTVNVNLGTYGSEPHFPFGGFGASGNGSREPGLEALDVYSELKTLSYFVEPGRL